MAALPLSLSLSHTHTHTHTIFTHNELSTATHDIQLSDSKPIVELKPAATSTTHLPSFNLLLEPRDLLHGDLVARPLGEYA